MLIALIWFRDDFRAHSDPGSLQQAVVFVPVYLLGVFLFTSITLFAERDHVTPDLTFWGNVETAYKGLIGLDGPYTYHRHVFDDFFETGAARARDRRAADRCSTWCCAPSSRPSRRAPSGGARAEEIVRRWGDDTLDYFALRRDKNYFFSADGQSLIAYLYVRGHGDGRRRPDRPARRRARGRSTSSSPSAPSAAGASPSSPSARPTPSSTASAACTPIYLGDEAILHCDEFSLDGAGMKAVRAAVKHVEKGHTLRADRRDRGRARS